jgi:arylformamidase
MPHYLDISLPIHPGMMVYKNKADKQPRVEALNRLSEGGSYETVLHMNVHTGTHLDFPLHMQANGGTSTGFDPASLITKVKVVDCGDALVINEALLAKKDLQPGEFILLKTRNSLVDHFLMDFTYLDASGAAYCVKQQLKGVGIDALGIERDQPDHATHHLLMDANILILEGLRLKAIAEGTYRMIALPLSMPGLDALPVRALLEVPL